MNKKLFLSLCFLICSFVQAKGTEVGNGGVGILLGQEIQVFDLYENGEKVLKTHAFDLELAEHFQAQIEKSLDSSFFPTQLISEKLAHLSIHFPLAAAVIVGTIKLYHWNFLSNDLTRLEHDFVSPIDTSQLHLVQIANRYMNTVLINEKAWKLMKPDQRMALVFHEALYSLVLLETQKRFESGEEVYSNFRSRALNSYLLHHDLEKSPDQVRQYFQYDLAGVQQGRVQVRGESNSSLFYDVFHSPTLAIQIQNRNLLKIELSDLNMNMEEFCKNHSFLNAQVHLNAESLGLSIQSVNAQSAVLVGHYPSSSLWHLDVNLTPETCTAKLKESFRKLERKWNSGNSTGFSTSMF